MRDYQSDEWPVGCFQNEESTWQPLSLVNRESGNTTPLRFGGPGPSTSISWATKSTVCFLSILLIRVCGGPVPKA